MPKDDVIEQRYLETVWIIFHKESGTISTEVLPELADNRVKQFQEQFPGTKVYTIQTDRIQRYEADGKSKRVYKLEMERLNTWQEFL